MTDSARRFEDFLLCLAEFRSAGGLEKPLEFCVSENIVIPEAVIYEKNIEILKYVSKKKYCIFQRSVLTLNQLKYFHQQ